jgi:hypothetical protein
MVPGLAAIAAVLVLLLLAAYGLMAGWFGGVSTDPDRTAPLQASAPSVPQPGGGADPPPPGSTAPPPGPAAGAESAAAVPPGGGASSASADPRAVVPPPPVTQSPPSLRSAAGSANRASAAPGRGAPTAGSKPAAAAPAQARPENPTVVFRCAGESAICASLRSAIGPAFQAQSILSSNDPQRADILVDVQAEFTGERRENMFGTTLVTRTYSIDVAAQTQQNATPVPMPPPASVSYDARVGQEKLNGEMRVLAAAVAEKVRGFWKN